MGNSGCSQYCSHIKGTSEVLFHERASLYEDNTVRLVTLIQCWYRAYKSRKKLKSIILNIKELQKKNLNLKATFKQSWDLYFKTKYDIEFSSNGLDLLKKNILRFYIQFFNKQEVINHENKFLIKASRIARVRSSDGFLQEFKLVFLPYLLNYFHLGNLEEKIASFTIECQNIEWNFNSNGNEKQNANENLDLNLNLNLNLNENTITNDKLPNSSFILCRKTSRALTASPFFPIAKFKSRNSELNMKRKQKTFVSDKSSQSFKIKISSRVATTLKQSGDSDDLACLTFSRYDKVKLLHEDKISLSQIISEITEIESSQCQRITMKDEETKIFYDGYWHREKQCKYGRGYEYMIDGNRGVRFKYLGYYKDGKYHGIGMHSTEDGYAYFGEFRNHAKSGYGYEYTSNSSYHGFFHNGQYCGYGEFTDDKVLYVGGFQNGIREYLGLLLCEGEFVSCGQYLDGKLNGIGSFHWDSGEKYFGNWVDDKMDGLGEFSWKNGDYFIGMYSQDMKHGNGEYTFKNGGLLRGNWEFGKKQGIFQLTRPGKSNTTELHYLNDIQT